MSRRHGVAIVSASSRIVGGHSVQAHALAGHLADEGIRVTLLPIDVPLPAWLGWVRRFRGLRTVINEVLYLISLRRLAGFSVVHAFSASYWSFLLAPVPAMLAGRLFRAKVVLHYHSGEVADHLERWGMAVHPWLRLADEIVVCSQFQQAVFERYGHRARVVPNVVALDAFTYRERRPLRPVFICTRNLEAHYGIDVIIEAFAAIRASFPDARLLLAGSGSCEPALRAQVRRLGIREIEFTGLVDPAAMHRLLERADIYLNASRIDNQPVSLIEAAASGLPIVSTRIGGIPEFVHDGYSGLLVDGPHPAAVASAAVALLAQPESARQLAREARSEVERFTWKAVRHAWADVYGMSLNQARASAPGVRVPVHDVGGCA